MKERYSYEQQKGESFAKYQSRRFKELKVALRNMRRHFFCGLEATEYDSALKGMCCYTSGFFSGESFPFKEVFEFVKDCWRDMIPTEKDPL